MVFTRNLQLAVLVLFSIGLLSACGGSGGSGSAGGGTLAAAEASPTSLTEGSLNTVTLTGSVSSGLITSQAWQQVSGPPVTLTGANSLVASFSVAGLEVAVDTVLGFEFTVVTPPGTISKAYVEVVLQPATLDAFPLATSQIGGATTTGLVLTRPGGTYVIANVGGALQSTKLGMAKDVVHRLPLPGFASDVLLIEDGANAYVLVAAGHEGLLVVDATDPTNMQLLHQVHVNYFQDGLTFAEGGGSILVDQEIGKLHGPIIALAIDDTGTNLFLAGEEYGIHRTALTNVLGGAGPVLEPDGTLLIEAEVFTLQYAGEKPWGEPHGLTYVGGRLFAALGELGMAIYDPATLERVGAYNLYTDTSVTEDWFAAADISTLVQPGFLDPVTGMPDYQQASFELLEVMHGDTVAPTPWAEFNITGRYYYHARQVVIAQQGARSIAYIAYALGGLVAVDVTGYGAATAGPGFLAGSYLGFLPAVPAHGPEHASTSHSSSLLPHFGSGRLKEAGYTAVAVSGTLVLATDHFAGLLVADGADFPEVNWRGTAVPYDNDTDGIAGNHTPTMEAVTSFDMSPADPLDEESLPIWMYSAPAVLVTGEVGGHGAGLVLAPMWDFNTSGGIDLVMLSGAGGMSFLDLDLTQILNADRFTGPVYHPTTEEIGAAPDGSPTQTISIGHADGVAVRGNYLFAADGPHGLSAWQVSDASGMPLDGVHLVANTLQDEYPQDVGGVLAYPTPHAKKVTIPEGADYALVACAGAGVRRVDLTDVLAGGGTVGAPWFMAVGAEDIYEHKTRDGDPTPLKKQDHAHDVVVRGNLAFTADGSNGMTIYDLAASPTDPGGSFYVGNVGGTTGEKPALGVSAGIRLWDDATTGRTYALVAAGPRGVGVVDVTIPSAPVLVKVFEPIKIEDGKVGHADGRAADVVVIGAHAYFAYDSFGIVCYALADLVAPLPAGIPPTEVWSRNGETLVYDHRPVALARFRLQEQVGQEEAPGGALSLAHQTVGGRTSVYAAYGAGGLVWIDWSVPSAPVFMQAAPTAGEASDVAIGHGRLFVADHAGGLVFFK